MKQNLMFNIKNNNCDHIFLQNLLFFYELFSFIQIIFFMKFNIIITHLDKYFYFLLYK